MNEIKPVQANELISELNFTTSRSSGPGGQNVNKVNSKVTLKLDVAGSAILTAEQKELITRKLATQLTKDGVLLINAQETRSQTENRDLAISKLDRLLVKAFTKVKARKSTKPNKAAKQRRLNSKKQHAEKKQWRQKP